MIKSKLLINLDDYITAAAIDNASTHLGSWPGCLTNIKVRKPSSSQRPLPVKKEKHYKVTLTLWMQKADL